MGGCSTSGIRSGLNRAVSSTDVTDNIRTSAATNTITMRNSTQSLKGCKKSKHTYVIGNVSCEWKTYPLIWKGIMKYVIYSPHFSTDCREAESYSNTQKPDSSLQEYTCRCMTIEYIAIACNSLHRRPLAQTLRLVGRQTWTLNSWNILLQTQWSG